MVLESLRNIVDWAGQPSCSAKWRKASSKADLHMPILSRSGVEHEHMQNELSSLGIDFYKAHRIYQRAI